MQGEKTMANKKNVNQVKKVISENKKPIIIAGICAGVSVVAIALCKAFKSMKESAKAQHEVDKANYAAAKAESKAQWEEAKAMGDPAKREEQMQAKRDEQITEANARKEAAEARINAVK